MLPNDEKYYINCTQVEVLVNFSMTDFATLLNLELESQIRKKGRD